MTYDTFCSSPAAPSLPPNTLEVAGTGQLAGFSTDWQVGGWLPSASAQPDSQPAEAGVVSPNETRRPERPSPGPGDTEQALLEGLLGSDPQAWREFDRRYCRLIERCIRRVIAPFPSVGPEDLREICATLWLQLLADDKRRLRGFAPGRGSSLSTWVAMLAMHCAYDYLRSLRREPFRVALADAERVGSPQPDPSEQCSARQTTERLMLALQGFSAKDQQFVHLYFGKGLGAEQVADRMGISVKTVYTKKHKIRQRLESMMADFRLAA